MAGPHFEADCTLRRLLRDSGQYGVMARRNAPRRGGRRVARSDGDPAGRQPASPGMHWRADGQPKSAYRSQGEALSVADERRSESGVDLNAYRCEICGGWHLGSYGRSGR
jgi:hypothetical protein